MQKTVKSSSPTLTSMLSYFAQLEHVSSPDPTNYRTDNRSDVQAVIAQTEENNETIPPFDWIGNEEKVESSMVNAKKGGILRPPVSKRRSKKETKIALSDEEEERLSHIQRSGKPRLKRQATKWKLQEEEEEKKRISHPNSQNTLTKNPTTPTSDNPKLVLFLSEPSPSQHHTSRVDNDSRGISPFKKSTICQKENRGSSAPHTPLHSYSAPPELTRVIPLSEKKNISQISMDNQCRLFQS